MKTSHLATISLLACMVASPTWAVYKCKDTQGRTSFQQTPCPGAARSEKLDVQPASGPSLATPPTMPSTAGSSAAPGSPGSPVSEADRLNALSARLAKENRLSTLNNLTIGAAQSDIHRAQANCQSEIRALRQRKSLANNNLAGATWEQSLSSEMQAIAARCDTEQRRLQAALNRYLAEKQDLERELAQP